MKIVSVPCAICKDLTDEGEIVLSINGALLCPKCEKDEREAAADSGRDSEAGEREWGASR